MKLLTKAIAMFDYLVNSLAAVGAVLIIAAMLIVSLDVVMRYLLHRPIVGVSETTEMILVLITFLGTTWLLRKDGHVKVDVVFNQLNPRIRTWLSIITCLVGMGVCLLLAVCGAQVTREFVQLSHFQGTALRLPTAPFIVFIPISGFLMFIQFLRKGYGHLGRWRGVREQ